MDATVVVTLLSAGAGYLLGSIPSGLIASRLRGVDLRQYGSGRSGATNTLRVLGWPTAAAVAFADAFKGSLAALLAGWIATAVTGEPIPVAQAAAILAAIGGHTWPVFAGFRGGRGIATSFGAVLVVAPGATIVCGLVFILVAAVTRIVSLASIFATMGVWISFTILGATGQIDPAYVVMCWIGCPYVLWTHRDNIQRLLAGNERRLFDSSAGNP